MRKKLCIGMILRSDDTVASAGTLGSFLKLGMVAEALELTVDFLPAMGAGKDLARAEVMAAFRAHSGADDLLWIDFGNGFPGCTADTIMHYLAVLLTSEREALYCPYTTRGGADLSFTCSPAGIQHPNAYVSVDQVADANIRVMRLGGCGFGFTRIRRSLVDKLYEGLPRRHFLSDVCDMGFGELDCLDVFSSQLGPRPCDFERPGENVTRLLPEDDTFWHWARQVNVEPYALVDFPADHGKSSPGFNAPSFADFAGLDVSRILRPQSLKRLG